MTLRVLRVDAVGEQRLAEPALIVGDEVRGGAEDVGGRAVVALEPDDGGARKILFEAQDVVDLGAAPAIDRLVVVADAADVDWWLSLTRRSSPRGEVARRPAGALRIWRRRRSGLRPSAGRRRLPRFGRVATSASRGRLARRARPASGRCASSRSHMYCAVLVSWYSSTRMYLNLRWYSLSTSGCCAEDADRVHQQVAEVAGVERREPILIGRIELRGPCRWRRSGRRPPGSRPGRAPCSSSRRSSGRRCAAPSACRPALRPG